MFIGNRLKEMISWNGLREIDLSEVLVDSSRVLTGVGFRKINDRRVGLKIYSKGFDFKTGNLKGVDESHIPETLAK